MRSLIYSVLLGFWLVLPVAAQDAQTLADIRAELVRLNTDIQTLRQEMTHSAQTGAAISGDVLQRVNTIEAQMAQMTAKTEQLENRINRVVADGTNRVGDLNFRLTELEGGDLAALGETPVLGGEAAIPSIGAGLEQPTDGVELAISEKADFDRAKAALDAGEHQTAAAQFETFNLTYPGGPLMAEAHYFRGEALRNLGQWKPAATAYLESFKGAKDGPRAPDSLYKLGLALDQIGQRNEACRLLQEVGNLFAGSSQDAAARGSMQTMGCI